MHKWVGFALPILARFPKYPMKMKLFALIETKLFHFHRILFENREGAGRRVQVIPLKPLWIRHSFGNISTVFILVTSKQVLWQTEMMHKGLHCLHGRKQSSGAEIDKNSKFLTCDPLKYKIDKIHA